MRGARLLGFVAVVLGAAASCGDPPPRPPVEADRSLDPAHGGAGPGNDTGPRDDAGTQNDGGEDPDEGACTELENDGPLVEQNAAVGDPPPGIGGFVEDGTYVLVEAQRFVGAAGTPGPTGQSLQGALRITGSELERVLWRENSAGTGFEENASGTFTQEGASGTIALTCPAPVFEQVTYSAIGTTLILTDLTQNESFTFTRQ